MNMVMLGFDGHLVVSEEVIVKNTQNKKTNQEIEKINSSEKWKFMK